MIEIRQMSSNEIDKNFLNEFIRYEMVTKAWRIIDGKKALVEVSYEENWKIKDLELVSLKLKDTLDSGGIVISAFDNNRAVGFASVEFGKFGAENMYNQLSELHVSNDYRGNGLGKKLFEEIANASRKFGVQKLYISASSCENTQYFYKSVGCVDALEINEALVQKEPYDIQLEYELVKRVVEIRKE